MVAPGLALLLAMQVAQPQPLPVATESAGRVRPRLLSIPPVSDYYPRSSLRANEQGRTRLLCRLLVEGSLVDCRLHEGSGYPALDEAAFKLASHARYSPMIVDGTPREAPVILPVRWVIPAD